MAETTREEALAAELRKAAEYLHQTSGAQGSGHIHMWSFEKCPHARCRAATAALALPATAERSDAPPRTCVICGEPISGIQLVTVGGTALEAHMKCAGVVIYLNTFLQEQNKVG